MGEHFFDLPIGGAVYIASMRDTGPKGIRAVKQQCESPVLRQHMLDKEKPAPGLQYPVDFTQPPDSIL